MSREGAAILPDPKVTGSADPCRPAHSIGSYESVPRQSGEDEAARLLRQAGAIWSREREALRHAGLVEGMQLLDVGCGPGAFLRQIIADLPPAAAVGLDRNPEHLHRAAEVVPVVRGDGRALPFAGSSFDAVLLRLVLRHVPKPLELLAEARRVVRPNGLVLAIDGDDGTLAFDPEPHGWTELSRALEVSVDRRGGDARVGRRLRRFFLHAGLGGVKTQLIPWTTEDMSPGDFIEVFLAPMRRPLDPDLLSAQVQGDPWSALRAWSLRPDAFGFGLGVLTSGRT